MMRLAAIALAFSLTACADFPELDETITAEMRDADFPRLATISQLRQTPEPRITEATGASLTARVAALRARASRLRGSVLGSEVRQRLNTEVPLPQSQ